MDQNNPASTTKTATATPSRLVFIFLDGTGNDFSNSNYTNLVRMVRLLRKDELATQLIYYGEGLGEHHFGGTAAQGSNISLFEKLTSMAFADRISEHILDAYRWLMAIQRKGDRIFVMGFSRGAYAAGCLCGLVETIGLLPRGNDQLVATGWKIYANRVKEDERGAAACSFRTSFSKLVRFEFLGLWDTVASVGFRGKDPFYFPVYHGTVAHMYHAMALDEPRNRFKIRRLTPAHLLKSQLFRPGYDKFTGNNVPEQITTTVTEVWFAGCHTDIGGGSNHDTPSNKQLPNPYGNDNLRIDVELALPNRALSFLTLRWMLTALVDVCKVKNLPLPEFDPLTLARYRRELAFFNPYSSHQVPIRSPHYINVIQQLYKEETNSRGESRDDQDEEKGTLEVMIISDEKAQAIMKLEVDLAVLPVGNAQRFFDPDKGAWEKTMAVMWKIREVLDRTFWEKRKMSKGDLVHVSVLTRYIASHYGKDTLCRTIQAEYEGLQRRISSGQHVSLALTDVGGYNNKTIALFKDIIPDDVQDHKDEEETARYAPMAIAPEATPSTSPQVWTSFLASNESVAV